MTTRLVRRAVLGGTFDRLHAGHEALLKMAFDHAQEVGIGITTDEFLAHGTKRRKEGAVRPFDERTARLKALLEEKFPGRAWYLIPLTDRWGAALERGTQVLVVSEETLPVGELANRLRKKQRIPPLRLLVCHAVRGEDLLRISSTRIRQGRIDRDGRRLTPVRVGVGSGNEVKRSGVETALHTLLSRTPLQVEVEDPGKPNPQPWGLDEGFAGAAARAELGLRGGRDWGVGVEATAFRPQKGGDLLDIHCIAVAGADGTSLRALSLGYPLPGAVAQLTADRKVTIEEAVRRLGGPPRVGHSDGGAIAYLTGNELSREGIIASAVQAAFVPLLAQRSERPPGAWS